MFRFVTFKINFNRKYVDEGVEQKLTLPGESRASSPERGYVAERKFWFSTLPGFEGRPSRKREGEVTEIRDIKTHASGLYLPVLSKTRQLSAL